MAFGSIPGRSPRARAPFLGTPRKNFVTRGTPPRVAQSEPCKQQACPLFSLSGNPNPVPPITGILPRHAFPPCCRGFFLPGDRESGAVAPYKPLAWRAVMVVTRVVTGFENFFEFSGTNPRRPGLTLCKRNTCPLFSLSGNPIRFPPRPDHPPRRYSPCRRGFLSLSNQTLVAHTLCHRKTGASIRHAGFPTNGHLASMSVISVAVRPPAYASGRPGH